jgi:serine phosphatase RsbU (regulator of sigma subunit)/anti-sigma regulatory factor (Ser/Thr protein kinase)
VLARAGGPVDVAGLADVPGSAALAELRRQGVRLVVPLVSAGELIGLLNLGPRLSEGDYSLTDRQLLDSLAGYAAPAIRVGQLVRRQEAEARDRERIEQQLQVARLIQQQFLPAELPVRDGWSLAALYRPASAVGGDFYDFIELPDGRLMVVVGDVTDKGVPAALVMSSTHALLRASAPRLLAPGAVLADVNGLLCGDIPAHMFVTCLVMVVDPATGQVEFANAGHPLPYVRRAGGGVEELRARGMPLGLLPEMEYEQRTARLAPGDAVLLHSDGLAEAHGPGREMFGFPRLAGLVAGAAADADLIATCLAELGRFTGPAAEQEDDITLVTLERSAMPVEHSPDQVLDEFTVPSAPGNEREALRRVASVAAGELAGERLERLKTAVAEAAMNAIEHGNGNDPGVPVGVKVLRTGDGLAVEITDRGLTGEHTPLHEVRPDLDLKLAGLQAPRGWGLFLIRSMVDEVTEQTSAAGHTVRLAVRTTDAQPV